MSAPREVWTDEHVEALVGRLLQFGVSAAAIVVLVGGTLFLVRHGAEPADHRQFRGEPAELRGVRGIAHEAAELHSRGMIQLGLLLLIMTPVARVALLAGAFARQRDYLYVGIAGLVLTILLYSLLHGLWDGGP